jgi:hypothetical protein
VGISFTASPWLRPPPEAVLPMDASTSGTDPARPLPAPSNIRPANPASKLASEPTTCHRREGRRHTALRDRALMVSPANFRASRIRGQSLGTAVQACGPHSAYSSTSRTQHNTDLRAFEKHDHALADTAIFRKNSIPFIARRGVGTEARWIPGRPPRRDR